MSPLFPGAPTRAAVVLAIVVALAYVWYVEGRGRWRALLSDRLLYGVPWGSLATVGLVVAFYLLVQGGAWHWDEPLVYPFVTWSYLSPFGVLTAGIAHASPEHLVANVATALVLAPIAEYAWSHYPTPSERSAAADESDARSDGSALVPDGRFADDTDGVRSTLGPTSGVLARPWVRALVVFPAAVLVATFVTSALSAGPSLGFSGAVFALAGFALVTFPVVTMVGMLAGSAVQTLFGALAEPVVRGAVESGPPAPPSWATVAVQSHALGFLLGVLAGLALLYGTSLRPAPTSVFLATLLFGAVQRLWLVVLPGGPDAYRLYRGVGVVLLLGLTLLVTVAVAGARSRDSGQDSTTADHAPAADGGTSGRPRAARVAIGLLVVVALLIAAPAPVASTVEVDEGAAPDDAVHVEDYAVGYVEDQPSPRRFAFDAPGEQLLGANESGVVVANPERELWTVAVRRPVLEHDGNATVTVGGVGWRETVDVERPAWDVVGADEVYAVDAVHDGERVRTFRSEPSTARGRIDGRTFAVRPTADGFAVGVRRDGALVAETRIPSANASTSVDGVAIERTGPPDDEVVLARTDDAEVAIAQRVAYAG